MRKALLLSLTPILAYSCYRLCRTMAAMLREAKKLKRKDDP